MKVKETVILSREGVPVVLRAGDEVPEWAVPLITNPAVVDADKLAPRTQKKA